MLRPKEIIQGYLADKWKRSWTLYEERFTSGGWVQYSFKGNVPLVASSDQKCEPRDFFTMICSDLAFILNSKVLEEHVALETSFYSETIKPTTI